MRSDFLALALLGFILAAVPRPSMAGPDDYIGDTAIYGGETAAVKPNVLVILDTSGSMDDEVPGSPYESSTTYASSDHCWEWTTENVCFLWWCRDETVRRQTTCESTTVYQKSTSGGRTYWDEHTALASVTTSCGGSDPRDSLSSEGQWQSGRRKLTSSGGCTNGSGAYRTGNYINWETAGGGGTTPKIDIAREVVHDLVSSTGGVNFGLMVFDQNGDAHGGEFYTGTTGAGNNYRTTIKDMDGIYQGSTTNREALLSAINEFNDRKTNGGTPLGETLYEAMRYFRGEGSAFDQNGGKTYDSPIGARCQTNYVVLVSDGMSSVDDACKEYDYRGNCKSYWISWDMCPGGDCDGDEHEPKGDELKDYTSAGRDGSDYLDDVAKYLFDTDMCADEPGKQNVVTYTVGFGLDEAAEAAGANLLLEETASNGGGESFTASDTSGLSAALSDIMAGIINTNSSFVAPVVPTSPENRTYSGSRVYLGFFKPVPNADWKGNLKKFGLNADGEIVDRNSDRATNADGSFKNTSTSYWSGSPDGGDVDAGGVGGLLLTRDFSSDPRLLYTYTGSSTDLTVAGNRFATDNADLSPTLLEVADAAAKDKLIHYIHGLDAYDDDLDGSTTEKRGWILGDILHSKPVIINYGTYTADQETDLSANRTMIFFGSNDGMLHAVRDADGKELWGFIPDNLLPDLRYLHDTTHSYFVDSSAVSYIYDGNNDGNIDSGDKVILIFGQRRGGGEDTLLATGSRGAYYALDVSNPESPQFLWKIDNAVTGFEELGETWSEPALARVRVGDEVKIVAFVGAGYDNNEDLRFGDTQTFPAGTAADTDTTTATADAGATTSTGTAGGFNARGRGFYALEVATLSASGVPTVASSPTKAWGYTWEDPATNAGRDADTNPAFSVASELAVLDSNYDGFVDRVYGGDTGGNLWRCSVGSKDTDDWGCNRIFASNPSDATVSNESPVTNGRKIFYRPSLILEPGYVGVYFGTGDRVHPMNTSVVDRIYSVKDKGQSSAKTEADLVNLTENFLQEDDLDSTDLDRVNNNAGIAVSTLEGAIDGTWGALRQKYGWFIRLDQNLGEKVLAPPLVFNRVASFTTYSPNSTVSADPCLAGNLGVGRYYGVDYLTAEAVMDFDATNNSTPTNDRALGKDGTLRRSDRVRVLGSGIPSGAIVVLPAQGDASVLIGSGGGIISMDTVKQSKTFPIYWIQE